VHTREGRLETLIRDYVEKTRTPTAKEVETLSAKTCRSHFLDTRDQQRLQAIAERHLRFMGNAEAMLQEAVDNGASMDRCVVQRCHVQWRHADSIVSVVEDLVYKYSKARLPASRPARRPPPTPRSLNDITGLQRRAGLSPVRRATGARTGSPSRPSVPALKALEAKRFVSPEEAKEAQGVFVKLMGPIDGKREFLRWLAELPVEALRSLQQQLPSPSRA